MVKITYVEPSGVEHIVDAKLGQSVMETAVKNGVPGISADCGGSCTCATCRVYIDETWRSKIGQAHETEREMLEFADDAGPGVRLSCQIKVTDELEGLTVRTPESQR